MKIFEDIKAYFKEVKNLEAFQGLDEKHRKNMVDIIKFQIEVMAIIIVIFSLLQNFVIEYLFEYQRTNWMYVGLTAYAVQIFFSIYFIFFHVLFRTYLARKKLYEVTINISHLIIFFEILSSIVALAFVFFGTISTLELTFSMILGIFCIFMLITMVLERMLDKEKIEKEKQDKENKK